MTMVDAAPIRAHVRWLQEAGLGIERLITLVGVSEGAVNALMYGNKQYPPSKRIHEEIARTLLSIQPTMDTLAPGATIDGTGTRRRLQALGAAGWPVSVIAARLDRGEKRIQLLRSADRCTVRLATEVAHLYAVLHYQRPHPITSDERMAVNNTLRWAKKSGWAPPAAWTVLTIDDPKARPTLSRPEENLFASLTIRTELGSVDMVALQRIDAGDESVSLPEWERKAAVLALHRKGWPLYRISKVTSLNNETVTDLIRKYCPEDLPETPEEQDTYRRRLAERVLIDGRMVHPRAPHGKKTGYVHWGCRCDPCTIANRRPAPVLEAAA